ncbi:MAG TPA: TRAP transporter TatT component family protein [Myxococcota bacterium]|nr:TRAP transporter TatT component family protein [Myxococcota bacterium]HQK51321.1 TRAP transporter TatT component family protein [Myxococcota bacterium]
MGSRWAGRAAVVVLCGWMGSGCLSWKSGWKVSDPRPLAADQAPEMRQEAREALSRSDSPRGSERLVEAWTRLTRATPGDREAWVQLAAAWSLRAKWDARTEGEQGEFYRNALQAAEKALAMNPAFRDQVTVGAEVWEALATLTPEDAPALGWWAFTLWNYYRDGLSGLVQMTQRRWLDRVRAAGERLTQLDPGALEGMGWFLQGVALAELPESRGGGVAAAVVPLDRALEVAPSSLRNRWARAVFVAQPRADRTAFRRDLLPQEAGASLPGHPGWNAWYARQARDLLAREESLF